MTGDYFPNHPDAHEALMSFGLDVNRSYERWMLELAPQKAGELLAVRVPDRCVVCDGPVVGRQVTCSGKCRVRLHRQRQG